MPPIAKTVIFDRPYSEADVDFDVMASNSDVDRLLQLEADIGGTVDYIVKEEGLKLKDPDKGRLHQELLRLKIKDIPTWRQAVKALFALVGRQPIPDDIHIGHPGWHEAQLAFSRIDHLNGKPRTFFAPTHSYFCQTQLAPRVPSPAATCVGGAVIEQDGHLPVGYRDGIYLGDVFALAPSGFMRLSNDQNAHPITRNWRMEREEELGLKADDMSDLQCVGLTTYGHELMTVLFLLVERSRLDIEGVLERCHNATDGSAHQGLWFIKPTEIAAFIQNQPLYDVKCPAIEGQTAEKNRGTLLPHVALSLLGIGSSLASIDPHQTPKIIDRLKAHGVDASLLLNQKTQFSWPEMPSQQ